MIATITGKIIEVLPKRTGVSKTGNEWASQSYVIEDESGDKLAFDVFGQNKIDEYNLTNGVKASVTVKIESKAWNGKYFTSVSCTQCISNAAPKAQEQVQPTQQVQQSYQAPQRTVQQTQTQEVKADDLPF